MVDGREIPMKKGGLFDLAALEKSGENKAIEEALIFHYNPESVSTSKTVNWNSIQIPGGNDTLMQFASGTSLTIPLVLFLNDFGETSKRSKNVETAIAFLHRYTRTDSGVKIQGGRKAPGVLKLVIGAMRFDDQAAPGVDVVITSLSVNRTAMTHDGRAVRATANIELTKYVRRFPR